MPRLYVGVTDKNWYSQLASAQPDEVNFWKPGSKGSFKALAPGDLFLFQLHAPDHFIVGGGFFVTFSRLPVSLAWSAFGEKNGVKSLEAFLSRIRKYSNSERGPDPEIGNIILTQPFWFDRQEWIPQPSDWKVNIVQGKGYDLSDPEGQRLLAQVRERLGILDSLTIQEHRSRYGRAEVDLRLGQGAFRVRVIDAYGRSCAITGEKTLPVLEAAHIQPYSQEGKHEIGNGLLLRSDMHILFDKGLLTVRPNLRIEVSSQIQTQYTNGKLYYSYQGQRLSNLPSKPTDMPSAEYLAWHNDVVFQP